MTQTFSQAHNSTITKKYREEREERESFRERERWKCEEPQKEQKKKLEGEENFMIIT